MEEKTKQNRSISIICASERHDNGPVKTKGHLPLQCSSFFSPLVVTIEE